MSLRLFFFSLYHCNHPPHDRSSHTFSPVIISKTNHSAQKFLKAFSLESIFRFYDAKCSKKNALEQLMSSSAHNYLITVNQSSGLQKSSTE